MKKKILIILEEIIQGIPSGVVSVTDNLIEGINKDFEVSIITNKTHWITNKKINFKNITLNQDYKASKEDLNYFKQSFESILFNKDFASIFNLKKIKKFIMEIS